MADYSSEFITLFWSKVDKTSDPDGCWLWTGQKDKDGYGQQRVRKSSTRFWLKAHRVAYELINGPIPEKMHVLHTQNCLKRNCVLHTYIGTNTDNIQDRIDLGRSTIGEKHPGAVLTNSDIIKMRNMKKEGFSTKDIENAFNHVISKRHTRDIIAGGCWKHLL